MVEQAYFVCRGKDNHILLYDLPDGETPENFTEKTSCRECGSKIDYSVEFNQWADIWQEELPPYNLTELN